MKITFGVITLNEESNLPRCLSSVSEIADEILVVDSGSTDATLQIAKSFQAVIHVIKWPGYVAQKNNVLRLASHEWVFSIDADEALSPELIAELKALKQREVPSLVAGFSMPRCVLYEGRWIRHGDWYPDRLTRLFRRESGRFEGGRVHERLVLAGALRALRGELEHHSFKGRDDHELRCRHYAQLWADDKFEQGRRCTAITPFLRSLFRFFRGYVFRGGFLDGRQGLHIARMCAYEVFLKYQKLLERLRN